MAQAPSIFCFESALDTLELSHVGVFIIGGEVVILFQ